MKQEILDNILMQEALKEAQKAYQIDEVPVGAIVVRDDIIISRAYTKKELLNNPLKHAEIIALDKAAKKLGTWKLTDCTIYTTLQPCELCSSAICSYRIKRVVYSLKKDKNSLSEEILKNSSLNTSVKEIKGGVLEDSSKELIQKYFQNKRK